MKTVLILGASRGIGLEFVRQYRAEDWRVIATARSDAALATLTQLGAQAHRLDTTDAQAVAALVATLKGEELDVAIYNAGVISTRTQGLVDIDAAEFDRVMHTNVLGAMHAAPVILPLVERANGVFAFLSSRMGSVSLMEGSNSWLYRTSKAALNAVIKAVSLETKRATCIALHPGWVRTDMGGSDADISVEQSVAGLRTVLTGALREHNGKFFNYDGTQLSW